MGDGHSRKAAEEPTKGEDMPLGGLSNGDSPADPSVGTAAKKKPTIPEPKSFSDYINFSKLQYGYKLISCCLVAIVVLSIVGHYFPGANPNGNFLGNAIELLKIVTTTALGYVFAKWQLVEKSPEDES